MPAGAAAGMLAVLQVVSGHQDDAVPVAPSGWTLAGSAAGTNGTFGAALGPRRLSYFVRELAGTISAPTVSIPVGGTGSVIAGRIMTLARTAGTGWRWATTFGEDTTSGTAFSAVMADALSWAVGDMVIAGYGLPLSTASATAETVTATGVTYGTVTERADDAITPGNDCKLITATCAVTAGAVTAAATVAATLASATYGIAGVLRVREASAAITASEQSVFPPRNLVSVTGLAADDIVTATVYRQTADGRTEVRAAEDVDVSTTGVLLRVDGEQPFGIALTYLAELTDLYGTVWTIIGTTLTNVVAADVISDAVRGIGAAVRIESPLEWKRSRDSTTFNVGGRIVTVGKPRSTKSGTLTVRTETDADGDDLNEVLDNLTEGVFLLRKQQSLSRLDGYFALGDDSESPNWYDSYRWFALDVQADEAWPAVLEAAGYTLQDIADNYTSLSDLSAAFTPGTLLSIALFDFGEA
ncbi:hypothetical protein ACIQU5_32025 [Streptomyces sp. NPDC090306]|uniref:hypothetical protein n=1 Tax=Streptomyces sp. NPDC090306 TaxID=3365961 RepID=UPI00381D8F12